IELAEDERLRLRIAENYIRIAGRPHVTEMTETIYTTEIADELLEGYDIPDADKLTLIEAITNNMTVEDFPNGQSLHAHTRALMGLNMLAASRSSGPAISLSEFESDVVLRMNARAIQVMKLRICAQAGASMVTIADRIHRHNRAWGPYTDQRSLIASIDGDQ